MPVPPPPEPPAGVMLPAVELRGVRKSFDGIVPAVEDLSLAVAAGEVVTLLGGPKSGKTTVLMLVAGFARTDAGEVRLAGRLMRRTPAHRRGLGVVLQDAVLLPHLSLAANVALPLALRRVRRAAREKRVAEMLALFRLGRIAELKPAQLSPEQTRRAALARALAGAPRLLLLDAPLAGLDRPARDALLMELRGLPGRLGVTMLTTTQDPAEAMAMAGRIGLMVDGRLRQIDTPAALYDAPGDAGLARLLGDSNRLAGVVEGMEDDIAMVRLACGPLVEARAAGIGIGRRCVVSVRPERVAVAAVTAEEMGEGAVAATVIESIFQGDHMRLRLLVGLPGAMPAEMLVKRPAGAPTGGMVPGAAVALAWQPYHAIAFQPEAGT